MNRGLVRYYLQQAGTGGESLEPVGTIYSSRLLHPQAGKGFASFFRQAFQFLRPAFVSSGKQLLSTGANILSDIATRDSSDQKVSDIVKSRAKELGANLSSQAAKALSGQGGRKRKLGEGCIDIRPVKKRQRVSTEQRAPTKALRDTESFHPDIFG